MTDLRATPSPIPDRDTLRMWMSALLDGELEPREEGILVAALERDPELLAEFEAMVAGEEAFASDAVGPRLTDAVMAAVAPEAVTTSVEGALRLTSLALDEPLPAEAAARLDAAMRSVAAEEVAGFAAAAELSQVAGEVAAEAGAAAAVSVAARVADEVAREEEAFALMNQVLDGEADDAGAARLAELLAGPAGEGRRAELGALAFAMEGVAAAVSAPAEWPEAARASAAALQAIEAAERNAAREQAAMAEKPRASTASGGGGFLSWLQGHFAPVFAPLMAAAAIGIFVVSGDGTITTPDAPGTDFFAEVEQELRLDPPVNVAAADLTLLRDNSSDVESIDTGTRSTMVFATPESHITVIWVPEPSDDDDWGDDVIDEHDEREQGT